MPFRLAWDKILIFSSVNSNNMKVKYVVNLLKASVLQREGIEIMKLKFKPMYLTIKVCYSELLKQFVGINNEQSILLKEKPPKNGSEVYFGKKHTTPSRKTSPNIYKQNRIGFNESVASNTCMQDCTDRSWQRRSRWQQARKDGCNSWPIQKKWIRRKAQIETLQ